MEKGTDLLIQVKRPAQEPRSAGLKIDLSPFYSDAVGQVDLGGDKSRAVAVQRFADRFTNDQQVPRREK